MGARMATNLLTKTRPNPVLVYDAHAPAMQALVAQGATAAASLEEIAAHAQVGLCGGEK